MAKSGGLAANPCQAAIIPHPQYLTSRHLMALCHVAHCSSLLAVAGFGQLAFYSPLLYSGSIGTQSHCVPEVSAHSVTIASRTPVSELSG